MRYHFWLRSRRREELRLGPGLGQLLECIRNLQQRRLAPRASEE